MSVEYVSLYEPLLPSQFVVLLRLPGQLLLPNCSNPQGRSCGFFPPPFFSPGLELQQSALPELQPPPETMLKAYLIACSAWLAASSLALAALAATHIISYILPPCPLCFLLAPTPSSPHTAFTWMVERFWFLVFCGTCPVKLIKMFA